jgi:hypothetical protein
METSEAEVVLDKETSRVLSYQLLREPAPDDSPWSDSFVMHNLTEPIDAATQKTIANITKYSSSLPSIPQNSTTSYGVLFLNSLLRASRLKTLQFSPIRSSPGEDLEDNAFNIRNDHTGLNMDFMSYASYIQAHKDATALLDADTLIKQTQNTFTTFFQHYVSTGLSLQPGGWVYQPIGTNLDGVGPAMPGVVQQMAPNGKLAVPVSQLPAQNTQRNTTATMTTRVEILRMNPIAFRVCIALLVWLTITTIVVAGLQRWYFGDLKRNIESLADVLVLVSGSEKLLALVRAHNVDELREIDIKTRLGWFRDAEGIIRWGIEVVEEED